MAKSCGVLSPKLTKINSEIAQAFMKQGVPAAEAREK